MKNWNGNPVQRFCITVAVFRKLCKGHVAGFVFKKNKNNKTTQPPTTVDMDKCSQICYNLLNLRFFSHLFICSTTNILILWSLCKSRCSLPWGHPSIHSSTHPHTHTCTIICSCWSIHATSHTLDWCQHSRKLISMSTVVGHCLVTRSGRWDGCQWRLLDIFRKCKLKVYTLTASCTPCMWSSIRFYLSPYEQLAAACTGFWCSNRFFISYVWTAVLSASHLPRTRSLE